MALARAGWGQSQLAQASVSAVQAVYGSYANRLAVDGKEKVYGSIP